jgi:hypothetical protein
VLGPLFRTLDARSAPSMGQGQRGPTARRRGDSELPARPSWQQSLVFDLSVTLQRFGSSRHPQQNGLLTIRRTSMRLCVFLRRARSIIIGNSTLKIRTFLCSPPLSAPPPACTAIFFVLFFYRPRLFLQETRYPGIDVRLGGARRFHWNAIATTRRFHWNAIATTQLGPVSDSPRGLLPEFEEQSRTCGGQAAALRINLSVEGCCVVAHPMHAPSRAALLSPLLLSHNLPFPRVHQCMMGRLVRTSLVVSHGTCPPLSPSPLANSFIIGTACRHNQQRRAPGGPLPTIFKVGWDTPDQLHKG